MPITAPVAGVVTAKLVEIGELVSPGTGLVVLTISIIRGPRCSSAAPTCRGSRSARARAYSPTQERPRARGPVRYVSPTAEFTPKNVQTRDERVKLVFR